jgi:hypothetical protein
LCTSELESLNMPESLRRRLFDRCWAMLHDAPPPTQKEERVLDLREGNELALQAMTELIHGALTEARITTLIWDHPPSAPSQNSTPAARPLLERLQQLYPAPSDIPDRPPETQ